MTPEHERGTEREQHDRLQAEYRWEASPEGELKRALWAAQAEIRRACGRLARSQSRFAITWAMKNMQLDELVETVVSEMLAERGKVQRLKQQVAELSKNLGELSRDTIARMSGNGTEPEPPDPAPEPYRWQVGDEIEYNGCTRRVQDISEGWVFPDGIVSPQSQPNWERRGWKLYRKASDPPPSPQLPAEPAPEPYPWHEGDEVAINGDVCRVSLIRDGKVFLTNGAQGTQSQLESWCYTLHRKAGHLPPEPYPWQIGDEIECNGVTRRKVIDRREGWVFLEGVTSPLSQPDWERRGWKLYRKASDPPPSPQLPAEPAPEPYPWQVGDELIREDGTIHTISQVIGGLLWSENKTITACEQWWLSENGYRLHRKALPRLKPRHVPLDEDLPEVPPFTPQQVAEFAEATEPIDDSVSAAAADEVRP